jgi:alpha-N-arabinofuranosidase
VDIDARTIERRVSPLLFGMHIEWVENGLGLLDPAKGRLRTEVLDLLRPLRIPLFRFPGGIHADYYDWSAGIGPPSGRSQGLNVFTKRKEPSRFGTPEFVELLQTTEAVGLITTNYGTGTAARTGSWARYLSDAGAPVDYWEVGNEIYLADPKKDAPNGKAIYRAPEQYAREFVAYRDAIRASFPRARVGAIAHLDTGAFPLAPAGSQDWTPRMLDVLPGRADFFALHNAYAPVILDDSASFADEQTRNELYKSLFASALQIRQNLDAMDHEIARRSPLNRGVPYAITEFGTFFGFSSKPDVQAVYVDQTRTLAAALYVASVLDVLIGDPRVLMACYTNPVHRWFGSLITDTDQRLVTTPTYHLYALYRSRFEPNLLPVSIASPAYDAAPLGIVKAHRGVADLIGRASISDNGRRASAMLVNRSVDRTLDTTIALRGFTPMSVDCRAISAESPAARNGPGLTSSTLSVAADISPTPFTCRISDGRVTARIPPSSILSLVMDRSGR